MTRPHHFLIAAALLVLPAAAVAHSTFTPQQRGACFVSGAATYQVVSGATAPDVRVRLTEDIASADLRLLIVDSAELADFVLVDDLTATPSQPCRSATPIRTVALEEADSRQPDVTVSLSVRVPEGPYTSIYVHSARFSHHDAAALLAAMQSAERARTTTAKASF